MKPSYLLFTAALLVLPAAGSPSTYNMTFTGGVYLNLDSHVAPLAPESGSFTYDPNGGFTNFIVQYQTESFDLTASANAPLLCNPSGLNCVSGDAATGFSLLTENPTWYSFESFSSGTVATELSLSNALFASAAVFAGFTVGDPPRSGTFTLLGTPAPVTGDPTPITRPPTPVTGDPTPVAGDPTPLPGDPSVTGDPTPDAAVPEPGVLHTLALAGLTLWCFKRFVSNL